jgi:hypothetical protein
MQPLGRRARRLLALFGLAVLLFNMPVLAVVRALPDIGPFPPLPLYLLVAWGLVILLTARLVERRAGD